MSTTDRPDVDRTSDKLSAVGATGDPPPGAVGVLASAFMTRARSDMSNPADLIMRTAMYLLVTVALSGLWRVAVDSAGGEMVGYGSVAIVWYIATTEVSIMSVPPRLIEYEGDAVVTGDIEVELLRPVDLFSFRLALWMGHAGPKIICCVFVGLVWSTWFGGLPEHLGALVLVVPALLLAVFNNVVAQVGVASSSHWIRDIRGMWFIYQKLVFVLGGMLLPLEVLPPGVESVAKLLPFMTMAYVPGRLAAGFFEPSLLMIQAAWTIALVLCARWLFNRGLEQTRRQP